jgi:hypothetical protein
VLARPAAVNQPIIPVTGRRKTNTAQCAWDLALSAGYNKNFRIKIVEIPIKLRKRKIKIKSMEPNGKPNPEAPTSSSEDRSSV